MIISIDQLKPNPDNPRTITPESLEKLKKSIQEFPEMLKLRPIIIDKDNVVLGGNMRLKALKELGITDVEVIRAEELTEDQKREFIIKDNLSFGDWDWDKLSVDFDFNQLLDWGVDSSEIKANFKPMEVEDDEFEIPEEINTDIVPGDYFEIGTHRLLCGDSTKQESWQKLCGSNHFNLIVTDPPYNVDYTGGTKDKLKIINDKMDSDDFIKFLYDFYQSISECSEPGASFYIFHADSEGHNFRKAFIDTNHHLAQCLIWLKNSSVMGRQDYHWKHEPILYGWKKGASHNWYSDRKQTTVLEFDRPQKNEEHPTMKPIKLISYLIQNSSAPNDLIGDGFLGSGSTMVASHLTKRTCYGMELDPKYCQVIIDRMIKLEPEIVIFKNGEPYKN